MEEATSLLTGEVIYDKYMAGMNPDSEYCPPDFMSKNKNKDI